MDDSSTSPPGNLTIQILTLVLTFALIVERVIKYFLKWAARRKFLRCRFNWCCGLCAGEANADAESETEGEVDSLKEEQSIGGLEDEAALDRTESTKSPREKQKASKRKGKNAREAESAGAMTQDSSPRLSLGSASV